MPMRVFHTMHSAIAAATAQDDLPHGVAGARARTSSNPALS